MSVQMVMGDNTVGTLGANLSQVALQAALLFNAVYAQKVWASGGADNEGGTEIVELYIGTGRRKCFDRFLRERGLYGYIRTGLFR